MTVKEKCKKYYPKLWNKERLQVLVKTGKLSKEDYKEVTGEEYTE